MISRGGRPESLTSSHRPYGNNKTSLEEVKRIRGAGGWVCSLCQSSAASPRLPLDYSIGSFINFDDSVTIRVV
jgi:hypothetical protein